MNNESKTELENQNLQDAEVKGYVSALGNVTLKNAKVKDFYTHSGYHFPEINVSYMTLGTLSQKKDNAVLITHALSGSAHVAGVDMESGKPGWWDFHVGPGKSIDTDKFFVIASNVIGGCNGTTGPASENPATGKPYGTEFPPVYIKDMVALQVRLLELLGIDKLFAVIGGSMGGMQALVWAVHYPNKLAVCIPIATCMAHSAMQIAFNEVGRQAIVTDPNWKKGCYYQESEKPDHGLAVARMVGHVTYLSEYTMRTKFGRLLQREARPDKETPRNDKEMYPEYYAIEGYLYHQGNSFVRRFDPNSYIYITKALDTFDLLEGKPAMDVLSKVKARFLIISFESDWLYPPVQSKELVKALKYSNIAVTYCNLETPYGHDSFLIENPEMERIIRNFLQQEYLNFSCETSGND